MARRICKECGGGIMRKDSEIVDDKIVDIWKCNNCLRWYVARKNKRKMAESGSGFTEKQEKTIARIAKKFIARETYGDPDKMEYKKWEVKGEDWSGTYMAIVYCETGYKGDENNLLSIIGRTIGQFFIKPSGKIVGAHIRSGHDNEVEKKYVKQWTG